MKHLCVIALYIIQAQQPLNDINSVFVLCLNLFYSHFQHSARYLDRSPNSLVAEISTTSHLKAMRFWRNFHQRLLTSKSQEGWKNPSFINGKFYY